MPDLQAYMLNIGAAKDGRHNAMPSILYWAWNDNSGDTGGLVDSTWYNLVWIRVRWLSGLGATPWYSAGPQPPSPPNFSSPPPPPSELPLPSQSPSPPPPPPSLAIPGVTCQARVVAETYWDNGQW